MELPSTCPQPIFIGGFNEDVNNIDTADDVTSDIENTVEGEESFYAPRSDPTESTGPFKVKKI